MPERKLGDVEGFREWASMLVNNHESYRIPDANAQVDFYGQDDSAYLVMNVYTGIASSIVYIFLAKDEKNENRSIILIFDFLKTVNYSLHELLVWLSNATYTETDMGDKVFVGDLAISRIVEGDVNTTTTGI